MNTFDDLRSLLVSSDLLQILEQHGVCVDIRLTDVRGDDVSPEVLAELDPVLVNAGNRLAHMRQLATLGELSATMVHEARNMLTGILGLSLVSRNEPPNLELLRKESARCSQLLNTFLSFAARTSGYPTVVKPFELAEAVSSLLSAEAKLRQCTLSVLVPKDFPDLVAPSQELRQVLVNLTLNAIQASPEGGVVVIDAEHVGSRVHLTVSDEGPGIPEGMFDAIFEPFVSSKPPPLGTGLGLSSSRRLVEIMHGTLGVVNRPHGGACFTVNLPRDRTLPKSYFPPAGPL
jgi:two-component system, NtrC family, sensor histidine kinase HydH